MSRAAAALGRGAASLGLALAGVVLAAGPARAEGYGAGEAAPRRDGFAIGFALGPSLFVGAGGLDAKNGVGGDFNLRVGTSASPTFLWQLELQGGGYLVDLSSEAGTERIFNSHATLTLGGQLYVRETLWLRAGAGIASFHEQEGRNGPEREGTRRNGLAVTAGAGYDMFRRGIFACDLELGTSGAVFDGAFIAHGALLLGLMWY
ncbi:MAG TPA: hypothetical protein VK698_13455 [Kofleriaceae bacterium]|nr:hypothetical protein [Kofleriaceae bacterium]